MKKVIHLIGGLRTGGAETLIKDYALKMDKTKWEIIVVLYEHIYESPYEKILEDNGIRLIFISDMVRFKWKNLSKGKRIIASINIYYYLYRILKEEKPDILHVHLQFLRYVKFCRPNEKIKIVYTVHNLPQAFWSTKGKKPYDRLRARLEYYAAKWLVKNRHMRFIALHDDMKRQVDDMFQVNNTIVLNNGIDFTRFNNTKSKKEMREALGIDQDAYVVGHVGRFSYQKNQIFLVSVFKKLFENNKKAYLLLVGEGPDKQMVIDDLNRKGLDDHYSILSNRRDVPDLLKTMDLFVFPSNFEGLGIALIEAQKTGLLCIASTNVPKSAVISNLAKRIPLENGVEAWVSCIESLKMPDEVIINDDDWNMDKVVEKLGLIYLDEI